MSAFKEAFFLISSRTKASQIFGLLLILLVILTPQNIFSVESTHKQDLLSLLLVIMAVSIIAPALAFEINKNLSCQFNLILPGFRKNIFYAFLSVTVIAVVLPSIVLSLTTQFTSNVIALLFLCYLIMFSASLFGRLWASMILAVITLALLPALLSTNNHLNLSILSDFTIEILGFSVVSSSLSIYFIYKLLTQHSFKKLKVSSLPSQKYQKKYSITEKERFIDKLHQAILNFKFSRYTQLLNRSQVLYLPSFWSSKVTTMTYVKVLIAISLCPIAIHEFILFPANYGEDYSLGMLAVTLPLFALFDEKILGNQNQARAFLWLRITGSYASFSKKMLHINLTKIFFEIALSSLGFLISASGFFLLKTTALELFLAFLLIKLTSLLSLLLSTIFRKRSASMTFKTTTIIFAIFVNYTILSNISYSLLFLNLSILTLIVLISITAYYSYTKVNSNDLLSC